MRLTQLKVDSGFAGRAHGAITRLADGKEDAGDAGTAQTDLWSSIEWRVIQRAF